MTSVSLHSYRIGSIPVRMTREAADRWNAASFTAADMREALAYPYGDEPVPLGDAMIDPVIQQEVANTEAVELHEPPILPHPPGRGYWLCGCPVTEDQMTPGQRTKQRGRYRTMLCPKHRT